MNLSTKCPDCGREIPYLSPTCPGCGRLGRIGPIVNVAKELACKHAMRQWFASPKFCHDIEIETINRCNGTCDFCPVNRRDDKRLFARMDDELLERILKELHQKDYWGYLSLFCNNEPLLDKHIEERVALARGLCPRAFLYLYTNGTLLSYERLYSLMNNGLDYLVVDNYDEGMQLHPHLREILERVRRSAHAHWIKQIRINIISPKAVRLNRAGAAPNKAVAVYENHHYYRNMGCTKPFFQMIIRPTGEVSLCCQDALGICTMGDCKTMSLEEIWYGPAFMEVRKRLLYEGRNSLRLCNECDEHPISRQEIEERDRESHFETL